jgi:hypothetical protein
MPPPNSALLPESVLLVIVTVPSLKMPPPELCGKALPSAQPLRTVTFCSVRLPLLATSKMRNSPVAAVPFRVHARLELRSIVAPLP